MTTFDELYAHLVKSGIRGKTQEDLKKLRRGDYDPRHLDCLLHPREHPPVWRVKDCDCSREEQENCAGKCLFHALEPAEGGVRVLPELCVGCSGCVERCRDKNLAGSKDALAVLELLRGEAPVYAIPAPAFVGQFADEVTPGRLRAAFKALGFAGMVEVALFADILTLRESLEFHAHVKKDGDYLLTSCCCPVWLAMVRRVYKELLPHVPGSVSPMVACGRSVKRLRPGAKVVFVGPCLAKKAEAREPDVADAVDFVLTFEEVYDMFGAAGINPALLDEDKREHSTRAGRIYAYAGGVSEAVSQTAQRLEPFAQPVRAKQAGGVPACRALLEELRQGEISANFLEGMGCVGGCVGGPRAVLPKEEGREHVEFYGDTAVCATPMESPEVLELLHRLGFDTIESLLQQDNLFARKLS